MRYGTQKRRLESCKEIGTEVQYQEPRPIASKNVRKDRQLRSTTFVNIDGVTLAYLKAYRRFLQLYKMVWSDRRATPNKTYFHHRVLQYRALWRGVAEHAGAEFVDLDDDIWEIRKNGKKLRLANHELEFDNPVTLRIAANKPLVHRLLKEGGLAVPEYEVFQINGLYKAYRFLERHPAGCVIKPAKGSAGRGVTTHILTRRELRNSAALASLYGKDLMIEAQIPGECYRALVLNRRMVHVVRRRGPRLKGDGLSTVSQLIEAENISRRRENKDALMIDRDCMFTLGWQSFSLGSIPEEGEEVLVKTTDNQADFVELRTVYNETVREPICKSIKCAVEKAADIVGSDFVGVDLILTDPAVPLEESGGVINEVNTTPALHHHYDPKIEKFPQPALEALSLILNR